MTDRPELSPRQAAARLGASTRSVQRWILDGRLPARRIGGRWRVSVDAIGAFDAPATIDAEPTLSDPPGSPAAPRSLRPPSVGGGPKPIRVLFVANRGEIAARIGRTCGRLGIRSIVPGEGGQPGLDLLDAGEVVRAARDAGADALHPGFGFLSENAAFAELAVAAGIRWVGPPSAAIRAMGDKGAARRLAASLGIPIVPGYDGDDQSDPALAAAATRLGVPLIVKPAGGGGGKGMRVVRDLGALSDALASARREARTAFGDDRLILERLLEGPRHVEVQVLFDAAGAGVHLGERDCSAQRRHQKVLEESPSPAVDERLRRRLGEAALALGAGVGYVNAGTCEFLLDDRGEVFFLEMNTRLQVEHPVTEAITGRDLVADQLRIAAGEPLGFDQADADAARARGGHAIEVRLYAEDAEAGFLPATGRIERLEWPLGEGIRVDAGIEPGTLIGERFDPLLAKIVAHGPDRAAALTTLRAALDETVVLGLTTNLRFLRWLVRQPRVVDGEVRIDTLERAWPPDGRTAATTLPPDAWLTAAALLAPGIPDGGWRLNARAHLRLASEDGTEQPVAVRDPARGPADGGVLGADGGVLGADGTAHVDVGGRSVAFRIAPPPDVDRAARAAVAHAAGVPDEVVAPMPGAVIALHVGIGDAVEAGDALVTLEAMKMEHVVTADEAGLVAGVLVQVGGQVARGQRLVELVSAAGMAALAAPPAAAEAAALAADDASAAG